jgi:hypothetical protein
MIENTDNEVVKLVVFIPETHADQMRQVLGDAGAGIIGNYHHCSFSIKGVGRFIPDEGAHPAIGEVGKPEEVEEERVETPVERTRLAEVLKAVRAAHPYEEPVIEVYPLINIDILDLAGSVEIPENKTALSAREAMEKSYKRI